MDREYFQFYDGDKMGIKTIEDGVIIPAVYDFVEPFSGGLFNVTQSDTHAYFDSKGKIVLPFQNKYESYGNFTEGLARVRINEKWGYIDKAGLETIKPQFHFAEEFSNDFAIVRNSEDKHGAIDKTGKLIIDYQFCILTKFENGYARFGDHKAYGLIDKTGKIVVPQDYISIGSVQNNKVKVQIKEGENYKEGILTIGGSIEWNNNLDKVNEFNRKRKEFITLSEELIQTMYREGCPCEYQRFRNYIQWDKPVSFLDQEEIFFIFSKHLEKESDSSFKCKSCGTTYAKTWEEYSIALQVINVKLIKTGNFTEKGAKVQSVIPVTLGFRGYDLDKLKKTYKQTDNQTVINYLREKPGTNRVDGLTACKR
jgi:hypothetical protein